MRSVAAAAVLLALAGCSSVADLGQPRRALAGDEASMTRSKVDEALKAKQFKVAWNLEAAAGTSDPARFEAIALATLDDEDSDAKEMLAQVRKKFGGYSPSLRGGIAELTRKAIEEKEFGRAVDIEILAADDAPKFAGAWNVYKQAPPKVALSLLESIDAARTKHEEEQRAKAEKR